MELFYGWPGLILVLLVIIAAGLYIPWLEEHYHCTAFTLGGVIAGIVFWLSWILADSHSSIIAGLVAAATALLMFLNNYGKSNHMLHGILMTLWQLLFGFIITALLLFLNNGKKKK